jgi:hypothetical protein
MSDASVSLRDEQVHAEHELSVSKLLIGISSGLSLLGALVMIAHFLAFQESRRCGRRLLFCLHLADAGAACAWLLVFLLPTPDEEADTSDVQTARICTICAIQVGNLQGGVRVSHSHWTPTKNSIGGWHICSRYACHRKDIWRHILRSGHHKCLNSGCCVRRVVPRE